MFNELHEECGVFGIFSPASPDVVRKTYYALYSLQHRGQESCGIAVNNDGIISAYRDAGLVNEVFGQDTLNRLGENRGAGWRSACNQ